jgi:hypothetical protein
MAKRWRPLIGTVFASRVGQWTQGSGIKSIQRGTISIAAGATSNTATITSVVTGNTRIKYLGYTANGTADTPDIACILLALTNATTLTATVGAVGTDTRIVAYEVIEYWPGVIRSVQRGTVTTVGAASNTATITAVVVLKSETEFLGFSSPYNATTSLNLASCRVVLTNETTVTATGLGAINRTIGFQVTEWY